MRLESRMEQSQSTLAKQQHPGVPLDGGWLANASAALSCVSGHSVVTRWKLLGPTTASEHTPGCTPRLLGDGPATPDSPIAQCVSSFAAHCMSELERMRLCRSPFGAGAEQLYLTRLRVANDTTAEVGRGTAHAQERCADQ
eukprot:CAMPEP_0119381008 /NCGR_PEP_ID=MMETSP1334-20130426/59779_1 /TAXON_ID=127549 /ORGANISM="Calcidiscus leptoporus, Strain RCC1130" /LENGTH=140 /DNA_ID=CAMNT_0007401011 /DNA_START=102 /DNA_END=521 /DNA_ORIENTATION=-